MRIAIASIMQGSNTSSPAINHFDDSRAVIGFHFCGLKRPVIWQSGDGGTKT